MEINKNEKLFLAVSKIYYAEIPEGITSDIESISENSDGTVTVTFNTGKDWKEIFLTKSSAVFSQKHKIVDEGDIFEQSVEMGFPGDGIESQQQLKSLLRKPLIIKLNFTNCSTPYSKLIGTLDNPCFFTENFKTQDYQAMRDISFSRQSTEPSPFIT